MLRQYTTCRHINEREDGHTNERTEIKKTLRTGFLGIYRVVGIQDTSDKPYD